MNDHELATTLANQAGKMLAEVRDSLFADGYTSWQVRTEGDMRSHHWLMDQLEQHRPDDAVLSEEGRDNRNRLGDGRVWIIDPLDGTHDFGHPGSGEWAVHVALVENGLPIAAAVSCPILEMDFNTGETELPQPLARDNPLVITSRSNASWAADAARAIDADLAACGSAGVKAMLVVSGQADVYVHGSGLYEWDVCAPAGVAEALGLDVLDLNGATHIYNKERPVCQGLVISRPEYTDAVVDSLRW